MRASLGSSALLTLLLAVPASAVQPPEGSPQGREPVRVHTTNPQVQALLAARPAWRRFVEGQGAGWEARFDEITGTPLRAWGPGLAIGPVGTEAEVAASALAFVRAHAELLDLGPHEPVVASARYVAGSNAWYVHVDTLLDGKRIWRGGVTLRIKQGRLVQFGAETYGSSPIQNGFSLTEFEAVAAFRASGPVPWVPHTDTEAEPMWLPEQQGKRVVLRAVWRVTDRTERPVGHWVGFVDAETGEVIAHYNLVRFLEGRLEIRHDDRLGMGDLEDSPLARATLNGPDGARTVTDLDGNWSLDTTGTVTVRLSGPAVRVEDKLGDVTPAVSGGDELLTAAHFGNRQAAATAFVHVQRVRDYIAPYAVGNEWIEDRVEVRVNRDDERCNAWFDGNLNFMREGGGCRNTGRLADVIYHEWGHGLHWYSLPDPFTQFDGSFGEGAADVLTFLMTDDHRLAPGFFLDRNRPLRDADNDRRYPDDYVPYEAYIHDNGMILSGAMWDSREALRATLGEPDATDVLTRVFVESLHGAPTIVTAYDELVFADDDDGDLANGTPNQCAFVEGFGKHGLGPLGGIGITPIHAAPDHVVADADFEVRLTLPNPGGPCIDLAPEGGDLVYAVGDGPWKRVPLDVDDRDLLAAIPAKDLAFGTILRYYTEVRTTSGATLYEPAGGIIRPHTVPVGEVLEIHCDDFEEDDGGYRHALLAGEDTEGADDWMWGAPRGMGGDPAVAASGRFVWGNDLGGGNYNGQYQAQRHNQLRTPALRTGHYEGVLLRYHRWLQVEDGVYDRALITADGEEVWSNWSSGREEGGEHHLDDRWVAHVVDLRGAGDDGKVRITWEIISDKGLEFGGWTLDDVCLVAPATPDNRLGIDEFTAARANDGTVALSWRMPQHAPVERVVVVRKRGGWPQDHTDGEVIFETDDVALGTKAVAVDEDAGEDVYYAAYATDGEHWLLWTREGFNAAAVDPRDGSDDALLDCACDGSGRAGVTPLVALIALALRRRRSAPPTA